MELSDLENIRDVPQFILPEIKDSLERAGLAGARPSLSYVGAGMYGIVFCDRSDHAWKVFRIHGGSERERLHILDSLTEEYEWLRDATGSEIARNVAEVYDIHVPALVLERECVDGEAGNDWYDGRRLRELHKRINQAMIPRGWTAPEYKDNSYIIRPDGTPVLVDISMVMRVGENLVGFVEDVLAGRRQTHERFHDLAYYVLGEMRQKTIPPEIAKELLGRLAERDPEIKRSFVLP